MNEGLYVFVLCGNEFLCDEFKPLPFIEDAAVPVERLPDRGAGVQELVAAQGTTMALYAHASPGCLHIRPLLNLKTVQGLRQYRAIAEAATDLVIRFEGANRAKTREWADSRPCYPIPTPRERVQPDRSRILPETAHD